MTPTKREWKIHIKRRQWWSVEELRFKWSSKIFEWSYTPSVPWKDDPFLASAGFYAALFCLLSGDSMVETKGISIFNNGSSKLRQTEKISGPSLVGHGLY